jgi:hypothetical protein
MVEYLKSFKSCLLSPAAVGQKLPLKLILNYLLMLSGNWIAYKFLSVIQPRNDGLQGFIGIWK